MSSKLLIFNLPQLVVLTIVNIADPYELVAIAMCSKRAFDALKKYRKKTDKLELRMNSVYLKAEILLDEVNIPIFRSIFSYEHFLKNSSRKSEIVIFRGHKVHVSKSAENENLWNVMWNNDREFGFKILIGWLSELFKTQVTALSFDRRTFWTMDWVQTRQKQLDKAGFHKDDEVVSDEEYRHVLDNCKSSMLLLRASPPRTFQYFGTLRSRGMLELLDGGFWITKNHLLTMDLIELVVMNSKLNNTDISAFLRHWLAGGCPRLKILSVHVEALNFRDILEDFTEYVHREPPKVRRYVRYNGSEGTVSGGCFLLREDGAIAAICRTEKPNQFLLAVWPDMQNNHFCFSP